MNGSAADLAATIAVVLLIVATVFQLALALGVPWGAAAWGGQHPGVLPTRLRVASGVTAFVVHPVIIVYVLVSSGLVTITGLPGSGSAAMWALTVLFVLGALMNFASRSRIERIWGPVTLVIAICCAVIALGAWRRPVRGGRTVLTGERGGIRTLGKAPETER